MDKEAARILTLVGWNAQRRHDVGDIATRTKAHGFDLLPAARDFLERFGVLIFTGQSTAPRSSGTYFHTVPCNVPTDPSWTEGLEAGAGTRVFPIGQTAFEDSALYMDEHGRAFGQDMYGVITFRGENADELLDAIRGYGFGARPVDDDSIRPPPDAPKGLS